ncbi:MAG TPA: ATP-dependent sacrificial sulfur transferase LarE [Planctomycetaceae bacterium]|nr:ATP-dependent sacrificial sulfur transferase LarE [Planctomycetaceae bacterium]
MDSPTIAAPQALMDHLVGWFQSDVLYVLALSGGVDSAVVACAAMRAGVSLVAVTAQGPSLSQRDLADAKQMALNLKLNHILLNAGEADSEEYARNDARRCYFCKSHLFNAITKQFPEYTILTGTNWDDLADYRPGLQAASEARVRAPLAELQIGKSQVRELAEYWRLPVASKPASPCLASRIAYGVSVTPERLKMIEAAEEIVRELLGCDDCRVRLHEGQLDRIEVPLADLPKLSSAELYTQLNARLQPIGFRYVTLDLAGLRSGNLNELVTIRWNSHGK